MKSRVKRYPLILIITFFLCIYLGSTVTANFLTRFLLISTILLIGFSCYFYFYPLFYRPVKDGVNPDFLIPGATYYISGSIPARFIRKDAYTGKFLFYIEGINNPNNPHDYKAFLPGEVGEYFAAAAEPEKE